MFGENEDGVTVTLRDCRDCVIRRVANGWVLISMMDDPSGSGWHTEVRVFEDTDHVEREPEASSLVRLLREAFDAYHQSKHRPGFVVEYVNMGRSQCEESE